jgi:subtilisin family serine protease
MVALASLVLLGPRLGFGAPVDHGPDEVLVRFRPGSSVAGRSALHAAVGAKPVKEFATVKDLQLIKLGPATSLARALEEYGNSPDVLYVEPNHRLTLQALPNDPSFVQNDLWGLNYAFPPFDDPDIDAPEAWDITTGSPNVVVAVIDTGIDYNHEDLAANMFRNAADCNQNGIDDDGNGWVDDCYGIDPIDGDSDPMDDDAHGSHVAGIIGAVGNNGVGVVGVNWHVKLMACKVFDANGNGTIAAAITCLDYVAMMKDRGVNIVATNNSWSDTDFSAALRDAIDAQRQHGILFMAAAGNYSSCPDAYNCRLDGDNDRKPTWPASLYLPNVLSVANSIDYGWLNAGSAYGRRTVHLAAPGTNILSTTPGNTYDWFSGTSMATPQVTGVAALLKAQSPTRDWKAIKNLILAGAEGDMFPDDGKLITDHRLNAHGALACANKTLTSRLRPVPSAVTAVVGQPMDLAVLNVRCAAPNGNVTVTVNPGGQAITLHDDGTDIDQEAGDGIYSGRWTPAAQGQFSITFPAGDVVGVQVLAGSYGAAVVPYEDRTITGTHLTILPTQPGVIESPFPIRFAGGSFTTVFVDERGAIQFDGGDYNSDLAAYNEPLPSPFHSTLVAPYWDQIMVIDFADVVWEVTGTAPNRELVVEWRNMGRSDRFCALFEGYVTFQVVFFEGRSDILFNYPDTTVGGECPDLDFGGSATVGIQVAPDVATQVGFNAPIVPDGTSLLWTLGGQTPQPTIDVTPTSADFGTVAVGASADATFIVKNTGAGTLIGQAQATAPFSILSGGAYSLAAGQTQTVTVRFRPTAAAAFAGTVAFTGGGGATRAVHGVGLGAGAPCATAAGWQLKLGKLDQAGVNTLVLRGSFVLAPAEFAAFDPSADGLQFALSGGDGGRIDLIYSGAAYDPVARKGWKVNASRSTFTFSDGNAVPGIGAGITKVTIKKSSGTSGLVKFALTGKSGSYAIAPPPSVDVVLGDGTCFEQSFPGPTPPVCFYNPSRTTLLCR